MRALGLCSITLETLKDSEGKKKIEMDSGKTLYIFYVIKFDDATVHHFNTVSFYGVWCKSN